jgi:uncharacterized protein
MGEVTFRFYAELNDFLPTERRFVAFPHVVPRTDTVKHVIESLGVPHTEVDLIVINGRTAGFGEPLNDGDYVSVYPVWESIDIRELERLRPEPLRDLRFVLDMHLGRLAAYLRMLGFDTWYATHADDDALARISHEEVRVLLTRDVGLLKRSRVTRGYFVRNTTPLLQLREVAERFDLTDSTHPFTRCLRCNRPLTNVNKADIEDRLPPRTRQLHTEFKICTKCNKIFWKGSHHQRMLAWIRALHVHGDFDAENM